MQVVALTFTIDDREWSERLRRIAENMRPALASAITSTAREARKAFARELPPDAVGGRKSSISSALKKQVRVPTIASPANLTSVTIVKPSNFDTMPLLRSYTPGNMYKPGGVTVSTFINTGGGSAMLSNTKFFVLKSNGGEVIMERITSAKGKGRLAGRRLTRAEVKKIYAEQPITAFKQENSRPRVAWDRAVSVGLAFRVDAAVREVLNGGPPPPMTSEG